MKKIVYYTLIALLAIVSFSSCLDDNSDEWDKYLEEFEANQKKVYAQYVADSILITDYLTINDSLATCDEKSGIFFNIIENGTENKPNTYSIIEVKYQGMLLNGTVFDKTETDKTVDLQLNRVITGWQYGIPKIGVGGKIILYLPSFYGYGETKFDAIPANSVLIYEVELLGYY